MNTLLFKNPGNPGQGYYYGALQRGLQIVSGVSGALLTRSAGNWPSIAIALSDAAAAGYYAGTIPAATPPGLYNFSAYRRAGGAPALGDFEASDTEAIWWSGCGITDPQTIAEGYSGGGNPAGPPFTALLLDAATPAGAPIGRGMLLVIQAGAQAGFTAVITGYAAAGGARTISYSPAMPGMADSTTYYRILAAAAVVPGAALDLYDVNVTYVNGQPAHLITSPISVPAISIVNQASSAGGVIMPISVFEETDSSFAWRIIDGLGMPVDLSGHTVNFLVHHRESDVALFTAACALSASNPDKPALMDTATALVPAADVPAAANLAYKVRDVSAKKIYGSGSFNVMVAP